MTSNDTAHSRNMASSSSGSADSLPVCCDSGCTVCVLDYPELFPGSNDVRNTGEPITSDMLEAIASAELLLEKLDSETNLTEPEIEGGQ